MRNTIWVATILVFVHGGAYGQTAAPVQFEVATVKVNVPPPGGGIRVMVRGGPGTNDPGRIDYEGVTLKDLLSAAYAVPTYQVSGPGWLDTERFDIAAKIPDGTTKEQFKVMLQNLLSERFKVVLHRDKKDYPIYELSVAKNGPKLTAAAEDLGAPDVRPQGSPPPGRGGFPQLPPGRPNMAMRVMRRSALLVARVQPVSRLVEILGSQLSSPVVDKTELTGTYDFTLEFTPEAGFYGPEAALPAAPPGGDAGPGQPVAADGLGEVPDLFTALQQQLGLKLEKKRGPLDVLVIDSAEKTPGEN